MFMFLTARWGPNRSAVTPQPSEPYARKPDGIKSFISGDGFMAEGLLRVQNGVEYLNLNPGDDNKAQDAVSPTDASVHDRIRRGASQRCLEYWGADGFSSAFGLTGAPVGFLGPIKLVLELTMRILLIEDNPNITSLVQDGLAPQGYELETVFNGAEGEERAATGQFDVIILDILLPDRNGIEVCKNLRGRGVRTPILMLTALTNTLDKVAGLEAGADDYLTKPFDIEELLARVRALVRRGGAEGPLVLQFDDLEINLVRRSVTRAGQKIRLTNKEFDLLEYLMRNPERVLTRDDIGRHVWDMNFQSDSNVIDVYISMLRRKIDRDFPRPLIQTVIGKGYKLGYPEDEPVSSEINVEQATSAQV